MHNLEFLTNYRYGRYEDCKYPNLVEIYEYFPTSYFANVTDKLMLAVFEGKEDLTASEMLNIAYYNNIPLSLLTCPHKVMLDRDRFRHRAMMQELESKLYEIWDWQKKGSHEADTYMKYQRGNYVSLYHNFLNNRSVSYGRYLGVRHEMDNAILFIKNEQSKIRNKPRDVKRYGREM